MSCDCERLKQTIKELQKDNAALRHRLHKYAEELEMRQPHKEIIIDKHGFAYCTNCETYDPMELFAEQSVFDRITASPEVLAEKLAYRYDGNGTWRSFLLYGYEFLTKEEAIAATLAKLKEVAG